MRCDGGDVHRPRCDADEEQEVIRDQSLERVYLDAQEIGCRQIFPVGFKFKKRRPSSVSIPLGGGLDAVFMEDVGYGAASHVMSQIGERAANARVSHERFSSAMRRMRSTVVFIVLGRSAPRRRL